MTSPVLQAKQIRKLKPKVLNEFGYWSFEGLSGSHYCSTFRHNIQSFLQECGKITDYKVANMPVWRTEIKGPGGLTFPLYTIQETLDRSPNPFCSHCKLSGWGHHYVSKRRYHFIVPERDRWNLRLKDDFFQHQSHVLHGLIHCNGYGHLICINGVEEDSYFPVKDESEFPCEDDAMNFWDCICSLLHPRAISVRDVTDVKLLHVLAFGHSWYGKWYYKFSNGIFGLEEIKYQKATEVLSLLCVDTIVMDFNSKRSLRTKFKPIINKNRGVSNFPLITSNDLLKFILAFEARVTMNIDLLVNALAKRSAWPPGKIRNVLSLIAGVVKQNKGEDGRINRQKLQKEAIKFGIEKPLIDFILDNVSCFSNGNDVIRSTNSTTKVQEFKIHEVFQGTTLKMFPFFGLVPENWQKKTTNRAAAIIFNSLATNNGNANSVSRIELKQKAMNLIRNEPVVELVLNLTENFMFGNQFIACSTDQESEDRKFVVRDIVEKDRVGDIDWGENLDEDVLYLYFSILSGYNATDAVSLAIRTILDSRHFVKEWPLPKQDVHQSVAISCKVLPSYYEITTELNRRLSPGEVAFLPISVTKGELRQLLQLALRDTYYITQRFIAGRIVELEKIGDNDAISCTIEPGGIEYVMVNGSGLDLATRLRYEDGLDRETVKCTCGAKYDDGERMEMCYLCSVVQHTKCNGIEDDSDVPSAFACAACKRGSPWKFADRRLMTTSV